MTININSDEYYRQDDMWGKSAEEYQRQVLKDIISLIPENTESILDVGCGDGHITNYLPETIRVIGLDISESALKHVKREVVIGDITRLPFPDKSIDLVMANDVLEHIVDSDYFNAIKELQRVAKKYLLITLPYNEDYQSRLAKCAECGCVYHINWHQRTYTLQNVLNLASGDKWSVREVRFSGDNTLPLHDPTQELKHEMGIFDLWQGSICPKCGSDNKVEGSQEESVLRTINAIRHSKWFPRQEAIIQVSKSEVIALYTHNSFAWEREELVNQQVVKDSLQKIDFSNPMQAVVDFIPGSQWPKFIIPEGAQVKEAGISILQAGKEFIEVQVRFPLVPKVGDCIRIIAGKKALVNGKISLYSIDGISAVSDLLYEVEINNQETCLEFILQNTWSADKFGLPLSIYVYGDVTLLSITYIFEDQIEQLVPFFPIHEGHNVFTLFEKENLRTTLSFYSYANGKIPVPTVLDTERNALDSDVTREDFFNEIEKSINSLKRKIVVLNNFSEEKESQRCIAETAFANEQRNYQELLKNYQEFQELILRLNGKLNEALELAENLEMQREDVEKQYKKASKYATFWHKNSSRRVRRVLVLSHMYPTEENQVGGSFIHEQVKALRENEGLDVRVISCRPFWLNGFNFFRLLKANKLYPQYLSDTKWTEYDGIPILYLPYKVGMPFLPFHIHGWTYSDAILKMIDKVWNEFKFDVIHAHTAYLDGNAALAISKRYKVPYLITEHTGPFTVLTEKPIVKQKTLNAIKRANRVLAVSDSLAAEIKSYFADESLVKHIGVLYNGVSTDRFKPSDLNDKKTQDNLRIMYIGYLEEVKDPLNLIKAFQKVHMEFPYAVLKIVGDGSLRDAVVKMVKELGIDSYVEILGLQSREKVAELIRDECDIFVLPSRSETFGVVIIEALASGKPVVATKCGGPESILIESYLGELCEKEDSDALAEAIIKVSRDHDKYDPKLIRIFAMEMFSMNHLSGKLLDIYQIV